MTTPVLPVVGGDTGLWGPKVNDYLTYLETAETSLTTSVATAASSAAAAQSAATNAQTAATAATSASNGAAAAAATADAKATQAQTDIDAHKNATTTPDPHPMYIKTVNGYAPDGSGNVVVAGGGGDVTALQAQVNTVQTTANSASSAASAAQTTANTALTTGNSALSLATSASSAATSAGTAASSAQSTANTANTAAGNAQTTADTANALATSASNTATTAAAGLASHLVASNPHTQYPLSVNGITPDGTGNITITSSATAQQVVVSGLAANGTTDDGPIIQAALDAIKAFSTSHSRELLVEAPATASGKSIYINSTVQIEADNVKLRFLGPVVFGASGRVRIVGDVIDTPSTGKPFLTANLTAGATTVTLNSTALFSIGDYVVFRGARGSTGDPIQKDTALVTNIVSGTQLTLSNGFDETYLAVNPNPGAPLGTSTQTFVTKVVGSSMTSNATRGDIYINLVSTSPFTVGDYVWVTDDERTVSASTGLMSSGNYIHREMAQVLEIVSGTQIRISHALHHNYSTSWTARVSRTNPILNSSIEDCRVTFSAMSTINYPFEIQFGVGCSIKRCRVDGDIANGYSWWKQAFRLAYSYFSSVEGCHATNPALTNSGEGYGATIYGSTASWIKDCSFIGLRHSILLFLGASGNEISGIHSQDALISDLDIHGGNSVDNVFHDCVIVGGAGLPQDGSTNKSALKAGNTTHKNGDHNNTFRDIYISNYYGASVSQAAAIEVVPQSSNNSFERIRVAGAKSAVKLVSNSNDTTLVTNKVYVTDSSFADITTNFLNVDGGANAMVQNLTIDNCRFVRVSLVGQIKNVQGFTFTDNKWIEAALTGTTYVVNLITVTGGTVLRNLFKGTARGVKASGCPSLRVSLNNFHDQSDTTVWDDAGGNTNAVFQHNDIVGFSPTTRTSGTGPSTGVLVDTTWGAGGGGGGSYLSDQPSVHSWVEWAYDPISCGSTVGQATTTGTLHGVKVIAASAGTTTGVIFQVGTTSPAGTLTSSQNYIAVFDSTLAQVAITADLTTTLGSSGVKSVAFTAPFTRTAGAVYYVVLLSNSSAGTGGVFVKSAGGAVSTPNGGLTSSGLKFFVANTGLTAMPSTLPTATSWTGTGAQPFWVALY